MTTAALFDLDGTLTDPQVGITGCIAHALRSIGRTVPSQDELTAWIGPPLYNSFRRHLGSAEPADLALQIYRERFSAVGLYENEPYPGIEMALDRIGQRTERMFVVTSKPRVYAERIVTHFRLGAYFDAVYGSELDGSLADKGELIAHVLHAESIDAASATMIGDRHHDISGAGKNSVPSVGALWGYGSRQELVEAGADRLCQTVGELPRVLHGD